MLILPGVPAGSAFRRARQLERLQRIDAGVQALHSRYVHFVDCVTPPDGEQRIQLQQLLTLEAGAPLSEGAASLLVVPRPGTISPWSSKATDIAWVCGLNFVRRIERGTLYWLEGTINAPRTALGAVLHDRMTETVLHATAHDEPPFWLPVQRQWPRLHSPAAVWLWSGPTSNWPWHSRTMKSTTC